MPSKPSGIRRFASDEGLVEIEIHKESQAVAETIRRGKTAQSAILFCYDAAALETGATPTGRPSGEGR